MSVFFKRYFQILSVEVNKQIFNHSIPIFRIQRNNYFSLSTNPIIESNGFDCFADSSDSDSNTDDDYPQYNDYQDIIDNQDEDYNENQVDWEKDLATEGNMDSDIRDSYE